jgi:glucosamine--fructose-6-phosphate aminotransferase (isomerizing)
MCGIVGYIGHRQAFPILIKGLQRLEYRGYDSSGIAIFNDNLLTYKKQGKVADLELYCKDKNLKSTIGLGHTRWATHGIPNDANAHPHYSQSKKIAIIHNGIIENYDSIKQALLKRGV